jgi:hypothetical protein
VSETEAARADAIDPRAHFHSLTRDEQLAAIRRLAREGLGDYSIAHACGLSVEFVRSILAERIE